MSGGLLSRNASFASFNVVEEGHKRLNRGNSWVLAVAIHDLARQALCHPRLDRYGLPRPRPGFAQLAL